MEANPPFFATEAFFLVLIWFVFFKEKEVELIKGSEGGAQRKCFHLSERGGGPHPTPWDSVQGSQKSLSFSGTCGGGGCVFCLCCALLLALPVTERLLFCFLT